MPCYRCGVRQTDPSRGQSPWKRGVRRDSQVLICPRCQASDDWTADLARCPRCGSVHLVRRLGEVECRDCGTIVPPSAGPGEALGGETLAGEALAGETVGGEALGSAALAGETALTEVAGGPSPDLSEEVARALERVLGRGLVSQIAPRTGADSH
jgi:ribosomal protein L40E